jgi:DNA-binding NtrC family response regulator
MSNKLWTLLVSDTEEMVRELEGILREQGMETRHVRKCSEAYAALQEAILPTLVFSEASLPDGTWAEVLKATNGTRSSIPLVVISRIVDIRLYLDAMESGVHDLIVPPLSAPDIAYIVRSAIARVRPCSWRPKLGTSHDSDSACQHRDESEPKSSV